MKILLPFDSTEISMKALENSIDIARENEGLLKILHIYWDPTVREYEDTEVRDRHSLRVVSEIIPRLERSDVRYEIMSRHHPDLSMTVSEVAEEEGIDLIILGKHGINDPPHKYSSIFREPDSAVLIV